MSIVPSSLTKHVPILHFFEIGTPATPLRIPPEDLESLISWLLARGYHPIFLSEYMQWMAGTFDLPYKQCIVLTFWGGYKEHYSIAYPYLQAQGVKFNLLAPASVIENEDWLQSGGYYGLAELQIMRSSGLCEIHSAGYHLRWLFQGIPAATAQIYKANSQNLKWGGIQEFVEDTYSYAPLLGSNNAGQAITTTYTFKCAPRQYRDALPAPSEITAAYLALDNLSVLGSAYSPTVQIRAKKHSDTSWTVIRNSWQPNWAEAFAAFALDAPSTFEAGTPYDLQFITQAGASGQRELVTLGNLRAGNPKMPGALWQASTYYPLGAMIADSQGDIQEAVTAGTSDNAPPSWNPQLQGLTNDCTVVWKNRGTPIVAGVATTCASNSSAPGFVTGQQIGGDIYLLESLACEVAAEVAARVYAEALHGLNLIAQWAGNSQVGYVFGYTYNAYSGAGNFLPAVLKGLHPVQLLTSPLLNDRWSLLHLPYYFPEAPADLPQGAVTPILQIDSTLGLAEIENRIDAQSGLLWDVVPAWDGWESLGWVNEWAANYAQERKKYAASWSYLSSPLIRFNADGVTFDSGDIAKVADFLALPEILRRPVLARVSNEGDAAIAHNVFSNAGASIAALQALLTATLPGLAGLAIDIEGAPPSDRAIASAWINALKEARDSDFPAKLLLVALPAKTADLPEDPWSGWCDYAVWLIAPDYAEPMTYTYSDWQPSIEPGPSSPLPWMQEVFAYASGIAPKSKLVIGLCSYGTWRTGGPNWSAAIFGSYYESLQAAHAANAIWLWDAENSEWYWVDAANTTKGYQPTPQSMKVRLDYFGGTGYTHFAVWAIGHGDSLFYKYAEGATPTLAPYLKIPQGVEQQVQHLEGHSSIGALELDAIDAAGYMSALVSQGNLEGKKATLKVGYPGLDIADFVTVASQQIENVTVLDDYTGFRFECRDLKRTAKSKVFQKGDDGHVISKDHKRTLSANPMDVVLIVLQNELGVGQVPGAPPSAWKIYDPAQWSGGANPTLLDPNPYLDLDQFLFYRDGIFAGYVLDFSFEQPVEAKQFLEYEIFKTLGGYLIVLADGRLSPRFFVPPYSLSGLYVFNDQNMTVLPRVERHPLINQVSCRIDHDDGEFQTELLFVCAPSMQQYGLAGQHTIESKGMRLARGGASLAGITAERIFRRYSGIGVVGGQVAGGAIVLNLTAQYLTLAVEVGDYVYLSHPLLPNLATGQRGVFNRIFEVIEKQPNFREGTMAYRLLDTGWLGSKRLSKVAPNGTPVWPSATSAQRDRYMFVCAAATAQYSDGTAGKTIF